MKNKSERIVAIVKDKNITNVELANLLEVKRQQLSNWIALNQPVPDKYLIKIVELFPDIDARWLITGEGTIHGAAEILKEKQAEFEKTYREVIAMKDKLIEDRERMIQMKDEIIRLLQK